MENVWNIAIGLHWEYDWKYDNTTSYGNLQLGNLQYTDWEHWNMIGN